MNISSTRILQTIEEAEGYLELNMPVHALRVIGRRQRFVIDSSHLLYLRARALQRCGHYQEAVRDLRTLATRFPENARTRVVLGSCYKQSGKLRLAIESLVEAALLEPGSALIHYNLACYWSLAACKTRALRHLKNALDINPGFRPLLHSESDFTFLKEEPLFIALEKPCV